MNNRTGFWLLGLLPLAVVAAFAGLALWRLGELSLEPPARNALVGMIVLGAFALGLLLLGLWYWLDRLLLQPLRALERGARIMSHSNPGHELELPSTHLLGALPISLRELGDRLLRLRRDNAEAMATGARESEQRKAQLEIVLRELSEGVLVCDDEARVLLYNPAAMELLPDSQQLGLGRSLYSFWHRSPIENTLDLLRNRQQGSQEQAGGDAEFVCAGVDGQRLYHCRMSLLPTSATIRAAFVIAFSDVTARVEAVDERPAVRTTLEDLRRPLANLRAAADALEAAGEAMGTERRSAFQRILVDESATLSRHLEALSQDLRTLFRTQWPLHDVLSADLLGSIVQRKERRGETPPTLIGDRCQKLYRERPRPSRWRSGSSSIAAGLYSST
ncbi:MAG: PAS domain-containing protein, partial [Candidatus Competibacterales bacterium]|nr:PAS domain-containing protein [Candidatus Competibacterales bacterium]